MIETLISSKTRIKILLKFFLNKSTTAYLRGLSTEFGESTNSIRLELNRLEKAGMLKSHSKGNKKLFKANDAHPLYDEVHNLVMKHVGLDQIISQIAIRLGNVKEVHLAGRFSQGLNSEVIDLIFVGEVNKNYLNELAEKVEKVIKRKIRYMIYSYEEFNLSEWKDKENLLLLWSSDE